MAQTDERLCDPVSMTELERRWAAVRALMRENGFDALVIQGANNMAATCGYYRWFTGISAPSSYAETVIFPRDGLMTLVCHGPVNGMTKYDGDDPGHPGMGMAFHTPSFPAIGYTVDYDAEIVAREIGKAGHRKVGYVGPNQMNFGFGLKLGKLLGPVAFVDATDLVDPIKAVKSEEEIALLRQTAQVQDETFRKTLTQIRPGMRDFEALAYSQYVSELMGGATGFFLGSSATPGEPALIRTRPTQGREIRAGDVLYWQAETTGPGGLFVHVGRLSSSARRRSSLWTYTPPRSRRRTSPSGCSAPALRRRESPGISSLSAQARPARGNAAPLSRPRLRRRGAAAHPQ